MKFSEWLESIGCYVQVTQRDDGSGYEVLEVTPPNSNDTYYVTAQA